MARKPVSRAAKRLGYETMDVGARGVALVAALFIGTVVVSGAVLGALLGLFRDEIDKNRPPPSPLAYTDLIPPEPRLQVEPVEELARVLAPQFERLDGYAWIDREAGIARIPIERAMAILAERGWPAAVPEGEPRGGPAARPELRPELETRIRERLTSETPPP